MIMPPKEVCPRRRRLVETAADAPIPVYLWSEASHA